MSPSAISASCWAAKAGFAVERAEKIAPATAVDVSGDGVEMVRGLGMERREICCFVGFDWVVSAGLVESLVFSTAVAIVVLAAMRSFYFFFFARKVFDEMCQWDMGKLGEIGDFEILWWFWINLLSGECGLVRCWPQIRLPFLSLTSFFVVICPLPLFCLD